MSISNKVQLVGRLGKNIELKTFAENKHVANFTLATNESFKNREGDWQENTTWHQIVAWDQLAKRSAKSLTKGSLVMIEGKLVNKSYKDKTGVMRYVTEIEMRKFMPVGMTKSKQSHAPEPKKQTATERYYELARQNQNDDLPF